MPFSTIFDEKKKFFLLLPIMYAWIFVVTYVLFYVFDLVNFVEQNHLDIFNNRFLLLTLWAGPCAVTLIFTGIFIDFFPKFLEKLILISLLGVSISLLIDLYSLIALNELLISIATIFLGFSFGVLIISSQTLYSIATPQKNRGKAYSIIIAGATLICIVSIALFDSISKKSPFLIPFFIVGVLGLIITLIFFFISKEYELSWVNDVWPTKLIKIVTRPSVIAYFWSNTLIWLMLGLMIGSLAQVQNPETLNLLQSIFAISSYKGFWIVDLFGTFLMIWFSGALSDRIGRKSVIIFCTTGIILASLVIAIFDMFLISTLIIGFSFACAFVFSSLWVDLASRDSIGRYNSLGIGSLGLGFILGFIISFFLYLNLFPNFIKVNIFILLGIAVFASLPLFWISDSYPPLEFFLLLITNQSGIPMFHYNFHRAESLKVDLSLISGALTAISSFMDEATGDSKGNLSLVRHGSNFIISEKVEDLRGSIFSNKNDPELNYLLKKFLNQFQNKYNKEIKSWNGNISAFRLAINDAEEVFGHLVTIKT